MKHIYIEPNEKQLVRVKSEYRKYEKNEGYISISTATKEKRRNLDIPFFFFQLSLIISFFITIKFLFGRM
jgi:hypothetical protein